MEKLSLLNYFQPQHIRPQDSTQFRKCIDDLKIYPFCSRWRNQISFSNLPYTVFAAAFDSNEVLAFRNKINMSKSNKSSTLSLNNFETVWSRCKIKRHSSKMKWALFKFILLNQVRSMANEINDSKVALSYALEINLWVRFRIPPPDKNKKWPYILEALDVRIPNISFFFCPDEPFLR